MLQTINDACEFDLDALDEALSEHIEDLEDLLDVQPDRAHAFFDRTFVTEGMEKLLRLGLGRLAGRNSNTIFEMRQAMGGGKTHSMLALGYLAAHPETAPSIVARVAPDYDPEPAAVIVVNGRNIDHDKFLWGGIAKQLGREEEFAGFWRSGAKAPNEDDWRRLLADRPILILFDELPPYLDYARTLPVGGGTLADVTSAALSNLFAAALKLPRLCIVLSTLVGQYKASVELQRVVGQITAEARRQAEPLTPVALGSNEIYDILRKRLVARMPPQATIESVGEAFSQALDDAVKSRTLDRSAESLENEVAATYPFHPSLKTIVSLFRDNEGFRQTRGLMTIAALMIKSVQRRRANDVYLIGPQHLDLADRGIRDKLNNIYDLETAITIDIHDTGSGAAHAQMIDAEKGNDAAGQAARLLLLASLAESSDSVKGLHEADLLAFLVAPLRPESIFIPAVDALIQKCWFLHKRESGAWYFSKNENLTKKIENLARNAPAARIDRRLSDHIEEIFTTNRRKAYSRVLAMPRIEDVSTRGDRLLIVLSPDRKLPPELAQRLFEAKPERNNFAVVCGDEVGLASVDERVRTAYAIDKVLDQEGPSSPNRPDLEARQAESQLLVYQAITSTLNKIWYPAREGGSERLISAPLRIDAIRRDGEGGYDGERAIETALTAVGNRKLVMDVAEEYDRIIDRAEEMLWPPTGRTTTWSEMNERAVGNVRWLWLPKNGLDELKRLAVSFGRWRENGSGGIEKGPFEKEKTSVGWTETRYDEATGTATLAVVARDAGRRGRVYWSETADVGTASARVDGPFETSAMRIFFLAIDPDGEHETGQIHEWRNRLTLTHEVRTSGSGYEVTLSVAPGGEIRWNRDGTSPRDGRRYGGPIVLEGTADETIYAYAEAGGVTTTRDFRIPRREGDGSRIDPAAPGRIRRSVSLNTTASVFALLTTAKETRARFRTVVIAVGSGARAISTSFGAELDVSPESIDTFVNAARRDLGDPNADVTLAWRTVALERAGDLDALMHSIGEPVGAGEVEQD